MAKAFGEQTKNDILGLAPDMAWPASRGDSAFGAASAAGAVSVKDLGVVYVAHGLGALKDGAEVNRCRSDATEQAKMVLVTGSSPLVTLTHVHRIQRRYLSPLAGTDA